ncbi:MAG: ABC transporter permease subunit [Ktedonobacterales bacterium]
MWFTSVFLKTLRDLRLAIVGWGLGMGVFAYVETISYAGTQTAQARASLANLGPAFAWYAEPIALNTPGGITNWRLSLILVLPAIWSLLASCRLLRGEEESGALDVLLAYPRGRVRVALEKLAALGTALLVIGLLIGLLTYAGGRQIHTDFGLGATLLLGLNAALIASVFGAIALLISQFTQQRRTAAGVTGGLLLVFVIMDMIHRVFPHTEWIGRLSPVYYYNLSKPLITSYGANPGAMLVLLGLTVLLSAAALVMFARRDVGRAVEIPSVLRLPMRITSVKPRQALPEHAWSLRSLFLRSLRVIAVPAFWWTVGIAGFAGWMALEVRQAERNLASIFAGSPYWKTLFGNVGGGDVTTNATLLSFFYLFLPLLVMAFAITQANRWAADEEEGQEELILATPQPRVRLLLARFASLSIAIVGMSVLTLAVTVLASAVADLKLDTGHLVAATLGLIPMGLLVAALGYLLAGWLHSALLTSLLSALLMISFCISFFGPTLNWPEAALRLSVLYYYGKPLVGGLPVGDTLSILAAAAVALWAAAARFVRKDIGR